MPKETSTVLNLDSIKGRVVAFRLLMPVQRTAVLMAAIFSFCAAAPASADLVFLTSGRSLSVKGHRIDGGNIILVLRGGGEVTCDRSLVDRIEPDEVPHPDDAVAAAEPPLPSSTLDSVPYAQLIENLATTHGVDPYLVKALIKVESNYRPRARSPKGAMGLMQIMPATARQYSVSNPFDPKSNIEAGIKHLKSLLSRFDVSVALAAYNAGEGAVRKFGGIPPYRETRNYVQKVLSLITPGSD
jgi:hypothetical protein